MPVSYLHAAISAGKAEACNKAKDRFDLFHVGVFLPQDCGVEMNVGCMGMRGPEWDGITLPEKAQRLEKEKKKTNIAAVIRLQQLLYKSTGALIPSS